MTDKEYLQKALTLFKNLNESKIIYKALIESAKKEIIKKSDFTYLENKKKIIILMMKLYFI